MKVALCAHHVNPTGGQDRFLLEMARRLPDIVPGLDLHLVAIRVEGELPAAVRVHRVRSPSRPSAVTQIAFAAGAALIVRRGSFDLVHGVGAALVGAHIITAQYCHAAWRAARRLHSVRDGTPLRALYRRAATRLGEREERRAYRSPNLLAITAVSRGTARDLEAWYGPFTSPPGPIRVIPNGVDLDDFRPERRPAARAALLAELGLGGDARLVLFVGAYERKGLDTAIQAVAHAGAGGAWSGKVGATPRGCPGDAPPHLLAVGEGDRRVFTALAHRAGIGDRFHPLPPRRNVADLFAAADAFIFPTRYDPFGMVVAEAMACAAPPVVSAVAGAAEYVENGVSGFVVDDPRDWRGFAAGLDALLGDPARRAEMGRAARQAARALSWDRIAREVRAVYAEAFERLATRRTSAAARSASSP